MRHILLISLISVFLIPSCQKHEGFGGKATIIGKVIIQEYNHDFTILKESYNAQAEDVYIIFGDNSIYDEKTETHFDGTFQFNYLQKGSYTVYVYSDDKEGNSYSGMIPVEVEIIVDQADETIDLGEIIIYKSTKENSGTSSVTGKIYALDYNIDLTFIESEYYAPEEDVYLVYGDEEFYMDDVKTNYDGTYVFKDLPVGFYKVYAYSKDLTYTVPGGKYPVFKPFVISEANQHIELEDIIINK